MMKATRPHAPRARAHARAAWVEKDREGPGHPRWNDGRMRFLDDEYRCWRQGRWELFSDEFQSSAPTQPARSRVADDASADDTR